MGSIGPIAVLLASALASLGAQTVPAGDDADQASLNRMRAALERPAPHAVVSPDVPFSSSVPTFHMQILQDQWFERNIPLPWQVEPTWRPRQMIPPGPFGTQPVIGVDLIWLSGVIVERVQRIRRAHAEAAAAQEVHQAIRDYCNAQPNGGAGILICSR